MANTQERREINFINKILVIEDDDSILEAVTMALEYDGHAVMAADRGDIIDDLVSDNFGQPRLIVLDILLSGKDGRDICRILKKTPETSHVPIVMMSAHPGGEITAKEAGADEFVSKPFNIDELLTKVRSCLS